MTLGGGMTLGGEKKEGKGGPRVPSWMIPATRKKEEGREERERNHVSATVLRKLSTLETRHGEKLK